MLIYVVFRRRQGLDLVTTTKVAVPKPVLEKEAEYESVLVALEPRHYSEGAIATAAKVAARRRRGIHVLVTITCPTRRRSTPSCPTRSSRRRRSSSRRACRAGGASPATSRRSGRAERGG